MFDYKAAGVTGFYYYNYNKMAIASQITGLYFRPDLQGRSVWHRAVKVMRTMDRVSVLPQYRYLMTSIYFYCQIKEYILKNKANYTQYTYTKCHRLEQLRLTIHTLKLIFASATYQQPKRKFSDKHNRNILQLNITTLPGPDTLSGSQE